MNKHICFIYLSFVFLLAAVWSCSTTKVIPNGQSRLVANRVDLENLKDFPGADVSASEISSYVRQKPNTYFILGWNPFLNVYNWSNGKGGGWDKFVRKIGQAPVIYDTAMTRSSLSNIGNYLVNRGFYDSQVKDSVVTKKKKSTVFYKVKLGKRYRIDSINYSFADTSIVKLFYEDLPNSYIKKGGFLSERLLEKEAERASQAFRNAGYYGFTGNYFFFKADTLRGDGTADLYVTVENYTRNEAPVSAMPHRIYSIDSVNVELVRNGAWYMSGRHVIKSDTANFRGINIIYKGKPFIHRKVVSRLNTIMPGSVYDEQTIANTYSRFSNFGMFSAVNINVEELDSNKVNTNIRLVASQQQGYKIGLNASTNSNALLGISPSISYYHKNMFKGGEFFNISFMGDFQYWIGKKTRSTEFGVSTSLSIPNFVGLPNRLFKGSTLPRTVFSLSYSFQERPEYTRNIISSTIGYTWNVHKRYFYTLNPIQLNIVNLSKVSTSFLDGLDNPFLKNSYQNHFDLGLGFTLYFTTNPDGDNSKSYFYFRTQTDIAGNVMSLFNGLMDKNSNNERKFWNTPYAQYAREELAAVYTLKFGADRNHALAGRFLVGIGTGYGNSDVLPFEKLFWAGGANSLRAWQARTVGPGHAQRDTTWSLPNQTGELRIEANLEYRFPLFWMFDGALFADLGNIWNIRHSKAQSENLGLADITKVQGVGRGDYVTANFNKGLFRFNNFYKHLAFDCGIGLRLNLEFVLLRLDMGFKVYEPEYNSWNGPGNWLKKNNYGIQFGVGYPF